MAARCATVTDVDSADYREVFERAEDALVFHSPGYLRFLCSVLPHADFFGFVIRGKAAMPTYLMRNGHGAVLNALPYYGGHGDVITTPESNDEDAREIAESLADFCKDERVDAVNVVTHPITPRFQDGGRLGLRRWDGRLGQISRLCPAVTRDEAVEATLSACNGKTRNLARKGMRGEFAIELSGRERDWAELVYHHSASLASRGGHAKTLTEFEALQRELGESCRLYVARREGAFVGGLVVLRFRDWAEYFTPVSHPDFRSEQVVPALIVEAMADARMDGARWWNWGGTWPDQDGVRHFKNGWGAEEFPYTYIGGNFSDEMRTASAEMLVQQFPRFYVRPFQKVD